MRLEMNMRNSHGRSLRAEGDIIHSMRIIWNSAVRGRGALWRDGRALDLVGGLKCNLVALTRICSGGQHGRITGGDRILQNGENHPDTQTNNYTFLRQILSVH